MNTLEKKRILLGVTGGIAAYKSAEIVRRLREREAEVRVVMTRAAGAFIGPLTFQALSGNPVHTELLDPGTESVMGHIELARWCDAVVIAPASANVIAKLAHGLADDLLTTLCLATRSPIVIAPAMNQVMWQAEATQANCRILEQRGVRFLGPGVGDQACGEVGPGRMLEPGEIIEGLAAIFGTDILQGARIVITAGPTREAIDPVRYLSNRSSGKMGYAIARAAREAGAVVILVSGPVALPPPEGVRVVPVESAEEMYRAVMEEMPRCDIFIGVAAVADYRPSAPASQKIKKAKETLTLALEPTEDILARVAALPHAPFTVGFAAETENPEQYARMKLSAKALDMIAVNQVNRPDLGFGSEENALQVIWDDTVGVVLPRASKERIARGLLTLIAERFHAKNPTQDP
jgi:phosphopantothenoylcysteine decarboxylase/phosphopantothenate--cysteine ligase